MTGKPAQPLSEQKMPIEAVRLQRPLIDDLKTLAKTYKLPKAAIHRCLLGEAVRHCMNERGTPEVLKDLLKPY